MTEFPEEDFGAVAGMRVEPAPNSKYALLRELTSP